MRSFAESTVYQIYVKSFNDSNGDGIGDIKGITQKLDYIKKLGVDYIWVTPFFCSPLNDNGYDISDYYGIDPVFGTEADVDELIAEADKRGIGLMFDMVFNHTSTEHEWFKKALSGDEHYMNYYIFRDPVNGGAPTNWVSKFGGNAWEYVPSLNKYYLHLFDRTQADLNWDNPLVREELKKVIRYWKDKGVKGFRFDVINLISKPPVLDNDYEGDGRRFYTDGPNVHEFIRELVTDTGIEDMVTVGEMSSTSIDNCIRYSNPANKELAMVFNFHHLKVDYKNGDKWELCPPDYMQLKKLFCDWQTGLLNSGGWNANFWCNHDQPRAVSRFANDGKYRRRSAKMLATVTHMLRGTPYIFQGEEIGMTNSDFASIEQYRDVESLNYYNIMLENGKTPEEAIHVINERSRDNGRLPMQWNSEKNAGFSDAEPWIGINGNYKEINAESEMQTENSIFEYYQKLIQLRKEHNVIVFGSFYEICGMPEKVFAFERSLGAKKIMVFASFSDSEEKITMPDTDGFKLLIGNTDNIAIKRDTLAPYEAFVLITDN